PMRPAARPRNGRELLGWLIAAIILVGGLSYWLGTRTAGDNVIPYAPQGGRPSATLPLPEATRVVPNADVQRVATPELRPVSEPEIHRVTERTSAPRPAWRPLPRSVPREVTERVQRTIATEETDRVSAAQRGAAAPVVLPPPVNTQNVRLWPARESAGAAGRLVQIGAFG